MAKLTEKQLFATWLDILYATQASGDFLYDIEIEVKLMRKRHKKNKKMLNQAVEHYKTVYGKEPKLIKGKVIIR